VNDVQERIAQLQGKGWTLAALADEVAVTVNAVEKWKAGDRYPTNAKLVLNALDGLARRRRIPRQRRYTKLREVAMVRSSIVPFHGDDAFDPSTPLPLHVAKLWGFPLQWHQVDDKEYFSIKDWIAGLTGSTENASATWRDNQRRADSGTAKCGVVSNPLPYTMEDRRKYTSKTGVQEGRTYTVTMPFTNDEGLYKIAVMLRITKKRTALRAIKDFLAKAGAFVDEARRDPEGAAEQLGIVRRTQALRAGKPEEWIATREEGVITRKQFVSQIYALVQDKRRFGIIIGTLTNDVYRGTFHDDVRGLRERLGISAKENPRDHFSRIALSYTTIAEEAIRIHLGKYGENDFVTFPDIQEVVQALSAAIGFQADKLAEVLRIDILTGQRVLPQGNR
jgi:transcriptional regulator with XRE-family HTH domain